MTSFCRIEAGANFRIKLLKSQLSLVQRDNPRIVREDWSHRCVGYLLLALAFINGRMRFYHDCYSQVFGGDCRIRVSLAACVEVQTSYLGTGGLRRLVDHSYDPLRGVWCDHWTMFAWLHVPAGCTLFLFRSNEWEMTLSASETYQFFGQRQVHQANHNLILY